jgi:phage terminase small subunit
MSAGKQFRAEIEAAFAVDQASPSARLVLEQLVRLLDELKSIEAAVAEHGTMIPGARGQLRVNPALQAARQHRLAIANLASKLGLSDETPGSRQARKAARARWDR